MQIAAFKCKCKCICRTLNAVAFIYTLMGATRNLLCSTGLCFLTTDISHKISKQKLVLMNKLCLSVVTADMRVASNTVCVNQINFIYYVYCIIGFIISFKLSSSMSVLALFALLATWKTFWTTVIMSYRNWFLFVKYKSDAIIRAFIGSLTLIKILYKINVFRVFTSGATSAMITR